MDQFKVVEVENVSGEPYSCQYDGNMIEFKAGESRALPANVAKFIVDRSYRAFSKTSALAFKEKKEEDEGPQENRAPALAEL